MIEVGKVRLFTINEVRRKFKVTGHTIRTYVRDGRLAGQKVGRSWYVSEAAIEDFFRSPYVKPKRRRPKK